MTDKQWNLVQDIANELEIKCLPKDASSKEASNFISRYLTKFEESKEERAEVRWHDNFCDF